jgi:hypothetical protein
MLKQKYFEENDWLGFKKEIGKQYDNMRTTPQKPQPFQKNEFKYSPEKWQKGFEKY